MRLISISYCVGKGKEVALVLLIGIDERGQLIGLRSDRLSNADIKKIKDQIGALSVMEPDQLQEHLSSTIQTYQKALVKMKNGRYKVLMEHGI